MGVPDSDLAISVVGDRTIRRLNRQYLGKDWPTNVISFPMQEGEFVGLNPELLGDVVISADTTAREAAAGGMSFTARLTFLLLHGILHLTGYDHERSGQAAARRMRTRERRLFALLQGEGLTGDHD